MAARGSQPPAYGPMELENIVANTVLLKAREGECVRGVEGDSGNFYEAD